ncbi:hypothetical protein [Lacihabitans lacunae]|uniref:REase associating with pPIWI RE domain-containing protein n=1 Tax=Lacihabitans lacunae TaxID=1028214 RepID=A0ABV7YTT7_9BACT
MSKEELLETHEIGQGQTRLIYPTNRIIISNAFHNANKLRRVQSRSEIYDINVKDFANEKIEYLRPYFEEIYTQRLKSPIDRISEDFKKNKINIVGKLGETFANPEEIEQKIFILLQEYGFIDKSLNSFQEIKDSLDRFFMPKKNKEIINEITVKNLFEIIKSIKELYVNNSYKRLYQTNQVLKNSLTGNVEFYSKLALFTELYEAKILNTSKEDSFVECIQCEHLTYKGVLQIKTSPQNLENLKCPFCNTELTYFVPYELNTEIYEVVKSKDGLLLDAFCNTLLENEINFSINDKFLGDIEVDCIFEDESKKYVAEVKMYKLNTTIEKLKSKVRNHFGKLKEDAERLLTLPEFQKKELIPILLINFQDNNFIDELQAELKLANKDELSQNIRILNLIQIKEMLIAYD